ADVDGDKRPDVLLADKKQFVWYRNPGKRGAAWDKFILAENLTENDNVCMAARDIDGDGKCEIAVGAEWNPGDTVNSGAVFYLIPPADRTQKWEAVKFPSVEPTTHRMKWVKREDGKFDLVVAPLHGRGNKKGEGVGVKTLAYRMPANPRDEWKAVVVSDSLHATHNFDVLTLPGATGEVMMIGGREGIEAIQQTAGGWESNLAVDHSKYSPPLPGAGEVRFGLLAQGEKLVPFGAAIEPMHGNALAIYREGSDNPKDTTPPRMVLDATLADGHALACGDVLGLGRDQIVVGWRAMQTKAAKVGIKMFVPDEKGEQWTQHLIDDNTMACEDLVLADLDADGKLDIVASGRATKNVKIYWNKR
ncbi:MAG: VCBS repeat-containing protein, partial [Chthoniobacteraceae bacterium]